jgi:hypothetical protein
LRISPQGLLEAGNHEAITIESAALGPRWG